MFVLSTFLITIGLSNFYSLNPCFAVIFQSINILVTPLFKSAFTVMSLCISIFSTPMSSYTSLNILNVLLTFFYLLSSLTVPFRVSVHVPLYCAFPSVGYTTSLQFYYFFFFLPYILGIKFFFFIILTSFSQLYLSFYTLYTPLSLSFLSLLLLLFSSMLLGIDYMFLTCFLRRNPCP